MNGVVAFVTYPVQPEITADDRLAAEAIIGLTGLKVEGVPWDRPGIAWENYDAVVLRSMWDYFQRPDEFRGWLSNLEHTKAILLNHPLVVRWNLEKTYLQELASFGVQSVPTVWCKKGEPVDLADTLDEMGWNKAVVKPTISGAAYLTMAVSAIEAASNAVQREVDNILATSGLMIQPFLSEVVETGEWSIVFFDGDYSHAVLKKPAARDFRVQAQFGGSSKLAQPSARLLKEAEDIVRAAIGITSQTPLYARVDGVQHKEDGRFLLTELELIEPALSFGADPNCAPFRFARALQKRLFGQVTPR